MKRIGYPLLAIAVMTGAASATPVSFVELTGVTGGNPQATGVFKADLSSLAGTTLSSVTIHDNSAGLGGSPGQFSGFDLDAVILSTVNITDASQVGTLTRAATFNFNNTVFTPGAQRIPTDPKLFGTDASGTAIDPLVATLDALDGNSTTNTDHSVPPFANGFVSLGDNGILGINLLSSITASSPLFLYIGEVGNNGEVAASDVEVSATPVSPVPEPSTTMLLLLPLLAVLGLNAYRGRMNRASMRPLSGV
jgi:hypothetical protein